MHRRKLTSNIQAHSSARVRPYAWADAQGANELALMEAVHGTAPDIRCPTITRSQVLRSSLMHGLMRRR